MLTMTKPRTVLDPKVAGGILAAIEIFKKIPATGMAEVERNVTEHRYAKRQTLFLEEDPADSLWFVKEGYVKEVTHTAEGRSLTLCLAGPGGILGTACFGGGEYGCHGVAETDAVVLSIPIRYFQELMGKYPVLARETVARISKLLRQSKDMHAFAQESAEKRVLHVLLSLVDEFGSAFSLTRREIAELAGTAVETTIRVVSRLQKEGFFQTNRGKFILRDRQALVERLGSL